ncbi:MAG: aminoglycoside phosphotransferase family protein [Gracilimonas sp.]
MNSDIDIEKVLKQYPVSLDELRIIPIKTGLIHHSYKIETPDRSYLLQKINTEVFDDVDSLMNNIALVTNTLTESYQGSSYESLEILKTNNEALYYESSSAAWRMYHFKEHLIGYESPKNKEIVWEAGHVFAHFADALAKTNPDQLAITIPHFHSLEFRYQQLREALKLTNVDLSDIDILLEKISEFTRLLIPLEQAMKEDSIPLRITHNDSKFNNLLFDSSDKARCVVDLDTVMPGIIHFDVGDCLRTLTPNSSEDEPDLEKITLRKDYHTAFLEGYRVGGTDFLTDNEINYLPYAAPYMSLIMGIRFLTDHLNGNQYYSFDYPGHNLVRSRCQVEVTRQFLNQFPLNR